MLDNDITGVIDVSISYLVTVIYLLTSTYLQQEFTIEDDQFGEKTMVELKEGGAKTLVTEENKAEYVKLVVSYRLDNSIKDQIQAFLAGFYE